jgi:hypothetical protein
MAHRLQPAGEWHLVQGLGAAWVVLEHLPPHEGEHALRRALALAGGSQTGRANSWAGTLVGLASDRTAHLIWPRAPVGLHHHQVRVRRHQEAGGQHQLRGRVDVPQRDDGARSTGGVAIAAVRSGTGHFVARWGGWRGRSWWRRGCGGGGGGGGGGAAMALPRSRFERGGHHAAVPTPRGVEHQQPTGAVPDVDIEVAHAQRLRVGLRGGSGSVLAGSRAGSCCGHWLQGLRGHWLVTAVGNLAVTGVGVDDSHGRHGEQAPAPGCCHHAHRAGGGAAGLAACREQQGQGTSNVKQAARGGRRPPRARGRARLISRLRSECAGL